MDTFTTFQHPRYGSVRRDKEPNQCPHCSHKISPEEMEWRVVGENFEHLECVFRCTNSECGHIFIANYLLKEIPAASKSAQQLSDAFGIKSARYELGSTWPTYIPRHLFPEEIGALSPSFVDIYHQAEEAEARMLLQVCGLGYRKAVEFLVKDYCISEHPADEEAIKKLPLAQCISKYIHDPRVEASATRAVWIGNDEAHYVRKWATKDIGDLKVLIRLTCNWIESALLTNRYRDEMPR